MVPEVEMLLPELTSIFKKYNVFKAFVFGKAARNLMHSYDEINFLIEMSPLLNKDKAGLNLFALSHEIREHFEHEVNVLTVTREDFPVYRHSFEKSKMIIYEMENTTNNLN
jgi:predicted nucleotidyltransferase